MASSVETARDLAELLRCPRADVRVGAAAAAAAYSADARFCTELFRADDAAAEQQLGCEVRRRLAWGDG